MYNRALSAAEVQGIYTAASGTAAGARNIISGNQGSAVDLEGPGTTGNGTAAATNDIAIAWPPNRPPIVIAAYFWGSNKSQADLNRGLADVARIVAGRFA